MADIKAFAKAVAPRKTIIFALQKSIKHLSLLVAFRQTMFQIKPLLSAKTLYAILENETNNTMKAIYLSIFFSLSALLSAQTIKTYDGTFENGKAKYQYYENSELERIYNGAFNYTASINSVKNVNAGIENNGISISGNFNENKKDGLWSVKDIQTFSSNASNKITKLVDGKYDKGQKVGKWVYTFIGLSDGKTGEQKIELNFKNNILIGKIDFLNKVNGQTDSLGNFQNKWRVLINKNEYLAEFKDGFFVTLVVRNVETGAIIIKYNQVDNSKKTKNEEESIEDDAPNLSEYIEKFSEYIESIKSLDKPLDVISLGSTTFEIKLPKILEDKK